jgi:hypothetical protein
MMKMWLSQGTNESEKKKAEKGELNPFLAVGDFQRASRYEQELKQVSRKGRKQKRHANEDKLQVCLHIKQHKLTNFKGLGMQLLKREVAESTIGTWWAEFKKDAHNKDNWNGPDNRLRWPKKALGRPLLLPESVAREVDRSIAVFEEQGARIFRQSVQYVNYMRVGRDM